MASEGLAVSADRAGVYVAALLGASSVAVSPDGRSVYAASFGSHAVTVFRRLTGR